MLVSMLFFVTNRLFNYKKLAGEVQQWWQVTKAMQIYTKIKNIIINYLNK